MICSNIPKTRCAIYARKSSEEGLEQEYNSLDAQRDSGEAYIKSQQHEGWLCLEDRYDDGGFTGGNMERPALHRLMADIDAGRIDCVVVYKVDRLSRSLLDFARIMEVFERNHVSFVSVTQQFNTATSMGRLILNVLLSFAQFERELIAERTRDKIAAAKRRGRYVGGMPVLGYDIVDTKLVVNELEAQRVREIFRLYLETESLLGTVRELERRGWRLKTWVTKGGKKRGGTKFTRNTLYQLLTNVTYLGKVKHKSHAFDGQHPAIVDAELFERVQAQLRRNRRSGGAEVRNRYGALLKGLLHCGPCDCAMGHSFTSKGNLRYRYYVCQNAQKNGWENCPAQSIPAGEAEQFVVDQIRAIGRDPELIAETLRETRRQVEAKIRDLKVESRGLARQLRSDHDELRSVAGDGQVGAVLLDRIREAEQRDTAIQVELADLARQLIDEADVATALASFDPVWDSLSPHEQGRVLRLLIARVEYDGGSGEVAITFQPHGIKTLAEEAEQCV